VVKLELSDKYREFLTFEECLRVKQGGDMPKNKRFPDYSSLLKKVIIVAMMRKLIQVAFGVLKSNSPFKSELHLA